MIISIEIVAYLTSAFNDSPELNLLKPGTKTLKWNYGVLKMDLGEIFSALFISPHGEIFIILSICPVWLVATVKYPD